MLFPYRGFLAFREEDADFVFGRHKYTDDLCMLLHQHSIVDLAGASGSGKFSIIQAGFADILSQLIVPELSRYDSIRKRITLAEDLEHSRVSLRDLANECLRQQKSTNRLLLFVDQWEDLYTNFKSDVQWTRIINEILDTTLRKDSPLNLVFNLRWDFYEQILKNRPISDRLNTSQLGLGPMNCEELQSEFVYPANAVVLTFQDGLVDRILDDAGDEPGKLRTPFAPLPEPPIMSGLRLRVLVIADPCEESPLPGAQQEGEAVAQLFEQFKESGANVELVRLFGPCEATRVAVLDHLINQRFDLVHYAGHCFFKADDPPRSGWLFSGNQVLSAYELSRVDRIPRFVFSNACESGITSDRADQRNPGLAPSFAESFFACGVCNFICTAWPVDDAAALAFASRFYNGLLGLGRNAEAIHEAINAARIEIAALGQGVRTTWGAYQHFGDPNFRIVLPQPKPPSGAPKLARPNTPRPRPAKKSKSKRK